MDGKTRIPDQIFREIKDVERRTGKKITVTFDFDLKGEVNYDGARKPIPFTDLNTLYASIAVVGDLEG